MEQNYENIIEGYALDTTTIQQVVEAHHQTKMEEIEALPPEKIPVAVQRYREDNSWPLDQEEAEAVASAIADNPHWDADEVADCISQDTAEKYSPPASFGDDCNSALNEAEFKIRVLEYAKKEGGSLEDRIQATIWGLHIPEDVVRPILEAWA